MGQLLGVNFMGQPTGPRFTTLLPLNRKCKNVEI